ncbi:hypothetical protein [Selenomonas noxia]|jgi:hypothetical protein|uniref:Glycine zipper 2TM domain-containing protein n=1 Tax=Selenomonas noxia F0398 TaxID=702437 RepID=A0ABP2MQT6_9FIRM|nr:hypothetical protein [Selenomonas noxia]EFF65321.1 hypothetical protein HMPREF7545_1996 [Selenomonas noxia ATCC 43541]EHG25231.1 hypothetical protein HMPREF9432_00611 [Selenomonas noxia F0398]MBF1715568.1 hypothetical protein [Selenomonas sp.]
MNTNKVKKSIAVALFGVMTLSLVGTSAAIAEASPRYTADVPRTMDVRTSYGDSIEVTQLAARRKKPRRKGYSQGSVTTAAIVGAVVGAFIAKNT